MPNPQFYFSRIAGKIQYERPELRDAYIKSLKPGVRYVESIKKYTRKRSGQQNSYYFGVIVDLIAKETGMSKDSTHDALRMKFLKDETGKLPTVRSTASLNTKEFMEYSDKCVLFAAEWLQIIIPEPYYVDI